MLSGLEGWYTREQLKFESLAKEPVVQTSRLLAHITYVSISVRI